MADKYRSFQSILNYPQKLFAIYQHKINQQHQLLALIKKVLPAELARHALYCVDKKTKLLLYTDSASWSSQLRFFHQAMLDTLHEHGFKQTETIQFKVMAPLRGEKKPSHARIPSRENIELLGKQAEQQQDRDLQRALAKLKRTLDKRSREKN